MLDPTEWTERKLRILGPSVKVEIGSGDGSFNSRQAKYLRCNHVIKNQQSRTNQQLRWLSERTQKISKWADNLFRRRGEFL